MKTTTQERQVRIDTLVHEAGEGAVQALLELAIDAIGVEVLDAEGHDDTLGAGLSHAATTLAAQIAATFNETEPRFAIGDPVGYGNGTSPGTMGTIKDRYLGERGTWEYQVRYQDGSGYHAFREEELHAPVPFPS